MKKISDLNSNYKPNLNNLSKAYYEALEDKKFKEYITLIKKHLKVEDELLMKYTSKLEQACLEFNNARGFKSLTEDTNPQPGYILTPVKKDKTITFSYNATPYMLKYLKDNKYRDNILLFDIPKQIKEASLAKIYNDDSNRATVLKEFKKFVGDYPNDDLKGLYLHGSFGSGKSYLIAALFNELAKKEILSAMIYYPEFLRSLKESFNTDFKERLEQIKKIPLLLLDDIGAENMTPWSRDEILGPILQYRMDEKLPTFFTSNLSAVELEEHLSGSKSPSEKIKARRIIERIKFLTHDIKLASINRRK